MKHDMTRKLLALFTILLSLACVFPASLPPSPPAIPANIDTAVPIPTNTQAPVVEVKTFTVSVSLLYVRDRDGEVVGYLHQGDLVSCSPTLSGWCMLDRGYRVWVGCLSEPHGFGCEKK
jgi:hypothetical protein